MDRETGELIRDEQAHIKQSIQDILLTPKGSRVMRRNYGSQLFQLIDRPLSAGLALQISAACVMALKRWEPRIEVSSFKVEFVSTAQPYVLVGTLEAIIKNSQTPIKLTDLNLTL